MIDISSASEVARATLYNHFRDKHSVIEALLASEVARIIELSKLAGTPADALESLSIAISSDGALASLRDHDPALIAQLLIHSEHPLYLELARAIYALTQSQSATGLAMRWLLGQAVQPLTPEQSREQAALLVEKIHFFKYSLCEFRICASDSLSLLGKSGRLRSARTSQFLS